MQLPLASPRVQSPANLPRFPKTSSSPKDSRIHRVPGRKILRTAGRISGPKPVCRDRQEAAEAWKTGAILFQLFPGVSPEKGRDHSKIKKTPGTRSESSVRTTCTEKSSPLRQQGFRPAGEKALPDLSRQSISHQGREGLSCKGRPVSVRVRG